MMTEYKELLVNCSCHDLGHMIRLSYYEDDPIENGVTFETMSVPGASLWHRLTWAWYGITNNPKATFHDYCVSPEDASRMSIFLHGSRRRTNGIGQQP